MSDINFLISHNDSFSIKAPAPVFCIYPDTLEAIMKFQVAHPEIDVSPTVNRAILSDLEKEEVRLNAS